MRNKEAVKLLLEKQAAFIKDPQGRDPLEYARKKGYDDICVMLETHLTVLTSLFKDKAMQAIEQGSGQELHALAENATKSLGKKVLDQLAEGGTLLHFACARNQPECVRVLLDLGADPNLKGSNEQTALHVAVMLSDDECVKQLLKSEVRGYRVIGKHPKAYSSFSCVLVRA